ncbi:glycoside hydrolase family protein [Hydrogenophaga crassostreae]|uniref:glycoside hydrolase family protein n=1 Tax=Hydrogenophaga crassostreae TaxID=1763535 RepID=UPI001E39BE42|nr:glycoside hydrolase family protein [Hydrogenophaga crassostreae]
MAALERMLILNEGKKLTVYQDSEGHPTVGIGFNLDRYGARTAIEAQGLDYDRVRAGAQSLTEAQASALLRADLNTAIDGAGRVVDNFDQLSFSRQAVLVDMCFNMGENKLMDFSKMRRAVERGDWQGAANEMENSNWFHQVGDRGPRMVEIMRTGAAREVLGERWGALQPGLGEEPTRLAGALSPDSRQLMGDSERAVRGLAQERGLAWDQGMHNTVAAVAMHAKNSGLSGISLLKVDAEGSIRFVQTDGGTLREGFIDAKTAANTPEAESMQALVAADQRLASDAAPQVLAADAAMVDARARG